MNISDFTKSAPTRFWRPAKILSRRNRYGAPERSDRRGRTGLDAVRVPHVLYNVRNDSGVRTSASPEIQQERLEFVLNFPGYLIIQKWI